MNKIVYFFSALVLLIIILPLAILSTLYTYIFRYKTVRRKFNALLFTIALSIDAFGNVMLSTLFNKILITDKGYDFGNWNETISQVTGENELMGTLTKRGRRFKNLVNLVFGENHCVRSVRMKEIRSERYLNRIHRIKKEEK